MAVNDVSSREIAILRKLAGAVVGWLVVMTLTSIGLGVALLSGALEGIPGAKSIWLCVVGGTLGSSISALLSAADRISHGWEFSSGEKYPDSASDADKFVARMVPLFVIRPVLGSAMGLLVYVGLTGGFLIAAQDAQGITFSHEGLLFLSILGGLFAKTFVEKLRAMFDTMLGK